MKKLTTSKLKKTLGGAQSVALLQPRGFSFFVICKVIKVSMDIYIFSSHRALYFKNF